MVGNFLDCRARAARAHSAAPPSATTNSRRLSWIAMRPAHMGHAGGHDTTPGVLRCGISNRRCLRWVVCHECRLSTAVRNCTRDGGGPSGIGNQVLISSHRGLPLSKAAVVSVAEEPGQCFRRGWLREASANKTLMKGRKEIRREENRGVTLPPG